MPLVNAKCTNCGGTLQVDNAKEAAVCPFCNGFKSISLFWKCKKCGIQYIREKYATTRRALARLVVAVSAPNK